MGGCERHSVIEGIRSFKELMHFSIDSGVFNLGAYALVDGLSKYIIYDFFF